MQALQIVFFANCFKFIAALVFEFCHSIFNKNDIIQIMKCKVQMKTSKNDRGIWVGGGGGEFGLTGMCFPPPGL